MGFQVLTGISIVGVTVATLMVLMLCRAEQSMLAAAQTSENVQ